MKFSDRTIKILKSFCGINQSIVFTPGDQIKVISPSRKVIAKARIEETFENRFGVFEVPKFLTALGLFENPEVEITDDHARIKSDGKVMNFTFTEPDMILSPKKTPIIGEVHASFRLPSTTLKEILKAAAVLGCPHIVIGSDGQSVTLEALNENNPNSHDYRVSMGDIDDGKPIRQVFRPDTINLLPLDYDVQVNLDPSMSYFKSTDGNIEYYIAALAKLEMRNDR